MINSKKVLVTLTKCLINKMKLILSLVLVIDKIVPNKFLQLANTISLYFHFVVTQQFYLKHKLNESQHAINNSMAR